MHERPVSYLSQPELIDDAPPAQEEASDLVVAIISYAIIGLMVVGCIAFAFWAARGIHLHLLEIEQGLRPISTGRRFSGFAWMLHETIGLWPTTFLFFAMFISPIPGIYFEIQRKKWLAQKSEA
jgi:hypothetical protein